MPTEGVTHSRVASRLKNEIGTIGNIVRTSYSRGRVCAADHGNMEFTCEGMGAF